MAHKQTEKKPKSEQTIEQHQQRKAGIVFEIPAEELATKVMASENQRIAQTFEVEHADQLPAEITKANQEELPNDAPDKSDIKLEVKCYKGLKVFGYSLLALFTALIGHEIYQLIESVLNSHWSIASLVIGLISIVLISSCKLLWDFIRDDDNIGTINKIRNQAQRMRLGHDFDPKQQFVHDLHQFYLGKPQAALFRTAKEGLADYHDNKEIIDHLDQAFLNPLDQKALKTVSQFSAQTGIAVAVSPWASLDMLLSLWRNMKMISDIGQIYGLRPSLRNRYKLVKMVMKQLLLVGASEIAIQQLIEEMGLSSSLSMVSARLGQGLGAGVYSAKIGLAAMKVSRPIPFSNNNKPKIKSVLKQLFTQLKLLK